MDMIQFESVIEPSTTSSTPHRKMPGGGRASGVPHSVESSGVQIPIQAPDPEVPEKRPRRKFTAAYKLRILEEADKCQPGEIGALLRREGLYSSNLSTWRRQRDQGILHGLSPQRRGRKPKPVNPLADRVAQLENENRQLQNQLRKAEIIIEAQKKISEILGIDQDLEKGKGSK